MKVSDILQALGKVAPIDLAEKWDNVGLLVGDEESPVQKVLCALDVTIPVIEEAHKLGASLIVTHHPIIFGDIKTVTKQTVTGQKIIRLIEYGISVISMHTNMDAAEGGVNDCLAEVLELTNIRPMGAGETKGLGRVGELSEKMNIDNFTRYITELLETRSLRYSTCGKKVHCVAVAGGACGSYVDDAIAKGADTYIVGDSNYHLMMEAKEKGINLIDAGHFATENVVVPKFASIITEACKGVEAIVSTVHKDCIHFR